MKSDCDIKKTTTGTSSKDRQYTPSSMPAVRTIVQLGGVDNNPAHVEGSK